MPEYVATMFESLTPSALRTKNAYAGRIVPNILFSGYFFFGSNYVFVGIFNGAALESECAVAYGDVFEHVSVYRGYGACDVAFGNGCDVVYFYVFDGAFFAEKIFVVAVVNANENGRLDTRH